MVVLNAMKIFPKEINAETHNYFFAGTCSCTFPKIIKQITRELNIIHER